MSNKLLYGKKDKWFVSDFETITPNTDFFREHQDAIVILANSYGWDDTHHTFTNIKDWWDFHVNLGVSQTIFYHNLSFDGDFILKFLKTQGITPNGLKTKKEWNTYEVFLQGNRIYYIRVKVLKYINGIRRRINIIIRCSLRILNSSVANLGKSVGLAKHHEDDNKVIDGRGFYDREPLATIAEWEETPDRARFLEYCRNDCKIVKLALDEFEKAVCDISFVKKRDEEVLKDREKRGSRAGNKFNPLEEMTTAAITTRLMKLAVKEYVAKNNMWGIYPLKMSKDDYNLMNNWFKGGFTQINDTINGEVDIHDSMFVDVSSAYPYQMTFSLPYGDVLSEEPNGIEGIDYYEFKEIHVKWAKIKPECYNCPILIKWDKDDELVKNYRYVREHKNFTCYYTNQEWETIKKFYDVEIKFETSIFMKASPYLKEYAQELYDIKNHYSQTKQEGLKMSAKILINAGYGCLAKRMKFITTMLLLGEDKDFFDEMEPKSLFSYEDREYEYLDYKNWDLEGDIIKIRCNPLNEKSFGMNKAAAVVITSRERVYLWELIYKIGCEFFYYSDTDSILFGNLTPEKMDFMVKLTSNNKIKLGDWEAEYTNVRYFGTHGAKRYYLKDKDGNLIKWRYAGVSANMINPKEIINEIDFNDEIIEFKNATLKVLETKSGRVLVPADKVIEKGRS